MNDTAPAAAEKFQELMKSKSNEERLLMGFSMFDTSREIARSAICGRHPGIGASRIKWELFLRFYGEEFSALQKRRVLRALETASKSGPPKPR